MRIKKYIAKSMREALLQIKEDLGEEAVILKTRKLPKKVFALGEQHDVEVTAAIDESVASGKPLPMQPLQMTNNENSTGVYKRMRSSCIVDMDKPDAPVVKPWRPPNGDSAILKQQTNMLESPCKDLQIQELKQNLDELRQLVKHVIKKEPETSSKGFSGEYEILYKRLIDAEVCEDLVTACINKMSETRASVTENTIDKGLLAYINTEFPLSGPLKLKKKGPLLVAFVGPTGTGKTTTLAKLAAHCSINKRKKVSIITADTYRIAAIEQVRIFADIVKVGLQVIFASEEIHGALRECAQDDIVFIDTAGRSQRNADHMGELKKLMDGLNPDEIHLVLSATTKYSDLKDIVLHYRNIGVNRLLFTKLDETLKIGNVFNIVKESTLPLSYFTFGQSVPDDIELAQGTRIAQRLLGENSL